MMRPFLLSIFLNLLFSTSSQAQANQSHRISDAERSAIPTYKITHKPTTGIENPPTGPLRPMAEWEELDALLIAWNGQSTILSEIVRAARKECRVVVCCNNQTVFNSALSTLLQKNIDTSNVELLVVPNNTIWIRDYGPNCVYQNDINSLIMVDWIYNRPRPKDDTLSRTVATYLDIPLYSTTTAPNDLVHTGGNFMTDGIGTAFSSKLIFNENDGLPGGQGISMHDEAAIDGILKDFMGIERYIKMENLPYDVIHHIDMHMKLLDEETLLVGEYPLGVADGPQIEANIQYVLSNFKNAFDKDYKVIRIPMPPDASGRYPNNGGDYRTYANSMMVNKTILVPFYQEQYDTTAQRIWEEAMPGYEIIGINCNSIIPSLGAIHCITKEVGVKEPLRIVHEKLVCQDNNVIGFGYDVRALVQHRSGISSAKLFWATNPDGPFTEEFMMQGIVPDGNFFARIPKQAAGETIYYYIEAEAVDGKMMRRPMVAPEGTWSFCVTESVDTDTPIAASLKAVFPNPASAITCVPVFCEKNTDVQLSLVNVFGQDVSTIFSGMMPQGENKYFFDAQDFAPGVYSLVLRSGAAVSTQKVIIQ